MTSDGPFNAARLTLFAGFPGNFPQSERKDFSMGVFEMLATGGVADLIYAALAVLALIGLTRWLDQRGGGAWRNIINNIRSEPLASAHYHGLRLLGFCILFAALLGR